MGLFDKLSAGVQKIGEKLTSDETKEAVKSGAAGIASGLQKLSDKIHDSISDNTAQPKSTMTIDEVAKTLMNENAGKPLWQSAYNNALSIEGEAIKMRAVDAMAIWRGVKAGSYEDMADAYVFLNYASIVADDENNTLGNLVDDIDIDIPEMTEKIFEIVNGKDDNTTREAIFLVCAHAFSIGTEKSIRLALLACDYADECNENEGGEDFDANEQAIEGMRVFCQNRINQFDEQFRILCDDVGDDELEEAYNSICDMKKKGLGDLIFSACVISLARGLMEESEDVTINGTITASVYLARCNGAPFTEYIMAMHDLMASVVPQVYKDAVNTFENTGRSENNTFLACAYLYGWGVNQDIAKALSYADALSKTDKPTADGILDEIREMNK